jgi:hypothetical protein
MFDKNFSHLVSKTLILFLKTVKGVLVKQREKINCAVIPKGLFFHRQSSKAGCAVTVQLQAPSDWINRPKQETFCILHISCSNKIV